jgi:hypothetical protein
MRAFARQAMRTPAALGVLAFWGGLWMAMRRYPSEFDWRFMTISSLAYPDRDPDGYRWAWGGIVLCALGGLCWIALLLRSCRQQRPEERAAGIRMLGLGYVCMVCCALLPDRFLPISKGHESLAIAAFVCISIGTVRLAFRAARRSIRLRGQDWTGNPRVYAGILAGSALLPILLGGIIQSYVSLARPDLPWVGLEWRARPVPVYLSFAFWEWTGCAVLSAYTALLCAVGINGAQATRYGFT